MEAFWTLGVILLGVANLTFMVLLLALTRQVGLILVRLGPSVARETVDSLPIGERMDPVSLTDTRGLTHVIQPTKYGQTLLVFVAPACESCRDLLKGLRAFATQYAHDVRVFVISTAPESDLDPVYASQLAPVVPYIRDRAFGKTMRVKATPYALLLDSANSLVSKGIVNSLEHLESLVVVETTASRGRRATTTVAVNPVAGGTK